MGEYEARIGILAIGITLASGANAADLPATAPSTAAPSAPKSCFASLWNWLNPSANDCPMTYAGITLYGTLDVGATFLSQGVGYSPSADKLNYFIQKNAHGSKWLPAYNALSLSVLGLKMKEDLGYGWSLVGVLEAGVNPYSGMFYNGPRSLADNNARPANTFPWQTSNFELEPSRSVGQFSGLYRFQQPGLRDVDLRPHDALAYDLAAAYDPVASYAFSMIGFSAAFANFGNTEAARPIAFTYRGTYQNCPRGRSGPGRRLRARQRHERTVPGAARRGLRASVD